MNEDSSFILTFALAFALGCWLTFLVFFFLGAR